MAVTQIKQSLGSFEVKLEPTVPKTVLNALQYFGHIAIVEGRINPEEYGDNILGAAKYVGVYRNRVNDVDNRTHNVVGSYLLRGVGMAYWLGDEEGKGQVIEPPGVILSSDTFANSVRDLLPTSVTEGTLHTIAGTYSGKHVWESPRKAITYVTQLFNAEWRVNNDGSVDAGTVAQLYNTTPTAMLVKNEYGRDMDFAAYEGKIDSAEDIEDFTTRVVLLAQGEGESIATGDADINPTLNPYKDLFGQSVILTRLVSESGTTSGNADARAELALTEFDSTRRSIRLATKEYIITGTLQLGEYIYVFDPDTGLFNPSNEVEFRGQRIYPVQYRCVEMTWPITEGMTVAFRNLDGDWFDLTDWVNFEAGDVAITIGELPRSLTGGWGEPIGTRPSDDGSIPAAPTWNTPFQTGVYLDGMGNTRAQVLLSWNQPLNTDGSTIIDGDHYEINYGLNPATEWQGVYAAWGVEEALISDLGPGLAYDIRIRAVDIHGHASDWSVVEAIDVAPDTIPPSTPAAPTVAGNPVSIQVKHDLGKASGGTFNLEIDLDHLEVHLGTTNTFTPSNSTIVGKMPANYGMMLGLISAVETFTTSATALRWIRVIAVDRSGNKSSPSVAASVTAALVDDAHISSLTVTKVTAGTVSANWLLGASIRTASSGQRVELNATGLHGYNSGGVELVSLLNTGSFTLRSASSGARVDLSNTSGLQLYNSGGTRTVHLDTNGSFELRSAASGARVNLDGTGFRAYNSGGIETVSLLSTGAFTLRSASSGSRIELDANGLRAYSGTTQTMDVNSSGDVTMTGEFLSGSTSGARTEIKRRSGSHPDPVIYMYTTGGNTTRYLSFDSGGFPVMDINNFDGCALGLWRNGSVLQNLNGPLNLVGVPVQINGTTKTFIIDHPQDDDRWLVHATTESPHNGVEYWGTAQLDEHGHAEVRLPAYFESLTHHDGRAVLLTGLGNHILPPTASYPTGGRFTVHGIPGQTVSWLVKAIRRDVPPVFVEPRRDEVTVRGNGPYRYYTINE